MSDKTDDTARAILESTPDNVLRVLLETPTSRVSSGLLNLSMAHLQKLAAFWLKKESILAELNSESQIYQDIIKII